MRYFLEFSYNGKNYHGWQIQPNGITVQEMLEKALSTLLRKEIKVIGAGRTDTGVHAKQMYAHFDVDESLDVLVLQKKLNSFLPADIAVHDLFLVDDEAHTRFDAIERTYEYWITARKNPFLTYAAYYLKYDLDVEAMNDAAKLLFEFKDFQCFSKSNTDVKTYFCDVKEAYWKYDGEKLVFTVTADRFLRNMVRAIVGTLLDVGKGKISKDDVKKIIESKNRSKAGVSVPAHGLYLVKVKYPSSITK
ncbi:tRNA pseudouridine(38-40) synthase TruA [Zhouia amylolytica]|uniref:tRNA pseudouridine synthase A n=1 Tax=Zhouia amylolytica AD3 TaxID=1286632 RepID=W2UN99_9FLAO|nr:tRNA pseudouridine(38-40) synthase TruA [Zhouia amylolytica]ETN94951.1 pseudouridylate synthase I [Zhouia amylolytica AD3]